MVNFFGAKHYGAKNAIYAPQVMNDYVTYKGNPTLQEYWLPNTTNALGYTVVGNFHATGGMCISDYSDVSYYGALMIAQGQYSTTDKMFYDKTICINFQTNYFRKYLSAGTGTAYKLVKKSFFNGSSYYPALVLQKIGDWNTVRDRYDDYAVVLTGAIKYEDSGIPRPVVPHASILSVSDVFGTTRHKVDGTKYPPDSRYNQNKYGGYYLFENFYQFSGTSIEDTKTTWVEFYERLGAEVIVFDTSITDKTGERPSGSTSTLCIIFPSEKSVKNVGNAVGVPFVINDENTARNGDPDSFPDYDKPGVPDNETGGGDGLGDNSSDDVDNPDNPQLSPVGGGNNLYCMTEPEMEQTFKFLWDGHNKDILGVTVSEANIIDSLCNCFYLPFDINLHDSGHCVQATVEAAGYASDISSVMVVGGYDKRFHFGDIDIDEYYGSYLDYAPYTSIGIYLPYIGFKNLDVSKCMGKKINVTYGVDFAQGIATAYIAYYQDGNKQVFAEYSGQMGIPIKVTGKNTTAVENAVKDAAFAVGGFALAAISVLAAPATGGASLIGTAGAVGAGVNAIGSTINATTIQPDTVSIGNAGAENWLISPQGCYIFIQRPRTATPENFKNTNGWATRYTGTISEFTGYLECSTVINTVSATAEEKNQITNLLKQGVYI